MTMSDAGPVGEADAQTKRVDEQQSAIRQANIEEFDQQIRRRTRLLQITLSVLLVICIDLIIGFVKGSQFVLLVGACSFSLAVWLLVHIGKQNSRLQKLRDDTVEVGTAVRRRKEIERRQREGIRPRYSSDIVVDLSEWLATNNVGADWVESETQDLGPTDLVLKWDHHFTRGLCVERNGKIVASRTLMHISWPI